MNIRSTILEAIASHGQAVIGVAGEGNNPTFSYTIGLTAQFGIELIMVGLRADYATQIMNDIAEALRRGETLDLGGEAADGRWANVPFKFKRCGNRVRSYVIQADHFYGRPVNVYQVIMSDRQGLFPGDPGFDSDYMNRFQPLL